MRMRKPNQFPLFSANWLGLFFGDVPERLNGADLKSARPQGFAGSNPAVSSNKRPSGSCSFRRGNLTTQPKATRSYNRTIHLRCVDFNRTAHNDLPQFQTTPSQV